MGVCVYTHTLINIFLILIPLNNVHFTLKLLTCAFNNKTYNKTLKILVCTTNHATYWIRKVWMRSKTSKPICSYSVMKIYLFVLKGWVINKRTDQSKQSPMSQAGSQALTSLRNAWASKHRKDHSSPRGNTNTNYINYCKQYQKWPKHSTWKYVSFRLRFFL